MFHRHKWEATGVSHINLIYNDTGRHVKSTRILYLCLNLDCSKVKTKDVDGLWSLEQVRGERNAT